MSQNITKRDKAEIEEAGSELTERQRKFVANLFQPGMSHKDCAIHAGYAEKSAHVEASRLLRNARVLEYIDVCMQHSLKADAVKARRVIADLSDTAKSDYVKLQSAQDIMDRAGYKPVEKHAHAVRGELTVNIDLGD
jgi:Phage terminase, small subunit